MFARKNKPLIDDAHKALDYAVGLLSKREYTKRELFTRLCYRFTKECAVAAVKKCAEEKWQSDERYCQLAFEHYINQGYGPFKISFELKKRGISASLYEPLLDVQDFVEVALRYLMHKYDTTQQYDFAGKQKILSHLARRGFSNDTCVSALSKFLSDDLFVL